MKISDSVLVLEKSEVDYLYILISDRLSSLREIGANEEQLQTILDIRLKLDNSRYVEPNNIDDDLISTIKKCKEDFTEEEYQLFLKELLKSQFNTILYMATSSDFS